MKETKNRTDTQIVWFCFFIYVRMYTYMSILFEKRDVFL
jgi:hypothetical protein